MIIESNKLKKIIIIFQAIIILCFIIAFATGLWEKLGKAIFCG